MKIDNVTVEEENVQMKKNPEVKNQRKIKFID